MLGSWGGGGGRWGVVRRRETGGGSLGLGVGGGYVRAEVGG